MKNLTNIKMLAIMIIAIVSLQSCNGIYANPDGVTAQKDKYVIFAEKPDHHTLTWDGAYQDISPKDGLADLRKPENGRAWAQVQEGTDGYVVSKTLYYMEIILWDGNPTHPYEYSGESTWVAFGPASKAVVGKPIKVALQGTTYSLDKDSFDRLNENTAGRATKLVAIGF